MYDGGVAASVETIKGEVVNWDDFTPSPRGVALVSVIHADELEVSGRSTLARGGGPVNGYFGWSHRLSKLVTPGATPVTVSLAIEYGL